MTFQDQKITRRVKLDCSDNPHVRYAELRVTARFDDRCKNGHNTFSLTADLYENGRLVAGGCLHDEIAEHFPELRPLIKWHLCNTDGPLHYPANTLYLAGDRDYNGRVKGEPSQLQYVIRFGTSPIRHKVGKRMAAWIQDPDVNLEDLEIIEVPHERDRKTFTPKYTFGSFPAERWHECPFDSQQEALEWAEALKGEFDLTKEAVAWSEGKERELDAARRSAIWPEATDAELMLPREDLKAKLEERLPKLLGDFRAAIESIGLKWAGGEI